MDSMDRRREEEPLAKTGIVLKGLKSTFTIENLQSILSEMKFQYNFLYLPWDSKRSCNSGLGFINFLDARSAVRCIEEFNVINSQGTQRLFRTIRESSAHGIARNLAFFMISAGMQATDHDHAPLVFDDDGHPIDLRSAISNFVTIDILLETKELWNRSRQGKTTSRMSPATRTRPEMGSKPQQESDTGFQMRNHRIADMQGEQAVPRRHVQQHTGDLEQLHRTWQEMQEPRQNPSGMPSPCPEELHAGALRGARLGRHSHAENEYVAAAPCSHSAHSGEHWHRTWQGMQESRRMQESRHQSPGMPLPRLEELPGFSLAHLGRRSHVENERFAEIAGSPALHVGPAAHLGELVYLENAHAAAAPCSHSVHSGEHWHRTWQAMQDSRQNPPGMPSAFLEEVLADAMQGLSPAHLGGHRHMENELLAAGSHSVRFGGEQRHGMHPMDSRSPYTPASRSQCDLSLFRRQVDASYDGQRSEEPRLNSSHRPLSRMPSSA
eukprot:TRINITY_DN6953_c0_g2_i1.p1 TRINITY_DN6953_c0_g2~~TRINITY_DN6953_c0_g2_i1.p1  ORF type:complete len:495 (-),score=80.60 TRINITY_DN6953_c0_g2_i1:15-1499(-)